MKTPPKTWIAMLLAMLMLLIISFTNIDHVEPDPSEQEQQCDLEALIKRNLQAIIYGNLAVESSLSVAFTQLVQATSVVVVSTQNCIPLQTCSVANSAPSYPNFYLPDTMNTMWSQTMCRDAEWLTADGNPAVIIKMNILFLQYSTYLYAIDRVNATTVGGCYLIPKKASVAHFSSITPVAGSQRFHVKLSDLAANTG